MRLLFDTISERDMDLLFLNAFVNDKGFLRLFIEKSNLEKTDYDIEEIYLSKSDKDGESDITVIINNDGRRYGLLIEDKIDAADMPDQPERYQKRGQTAQDKKEFEEFDVFIVCPEKYLNNNDAAKRYPHYIKYEEIREYWSEKSEPQYEIYYQQICQAIEKAKKPPKVVLTKEQRRKNMQHIKSTDTKIEIMLRKALWKNGFRYRKNYNGLPEKPDVVLTKQRIVIFCDSEFFHGKDWDELKERLQKGETGQYWINKIQRNMERDREIDKELLSLGWKTIHFWGADISRNLEGCVKTIEEAVFEQKVCGLEGYDWMSTNDLL